MASEILCSHCGTANQPTESFCEECGAALNVPPILLNQRYRRLNKLGEGGFGVVYRVEDTKLANRMLAAKKLLPEDPTSVSSKPSQEAIDAFQRESSILATLKHPNLPEVYDCFEANSDYYLIMEYIDGQTLKKHLEKLGQGCLSVEEALRIGIELAAALDYLHTRTPQPIIFRDLNPANIMLTQAGQVYLIDFGIARHFKPGQKKDTTNLGTYGYASPEHYNAQTTALSDIYSLGAIMHQLLSGEDPQDRALFQFPELLLQGSSQAELAELIMNMLSMNAQQRPASAAEVKQKFQQILQDLQQPTSAPVAQAKPTTLLPNNASAAPQQKLGIFQSLAATPASQSKARGELCYSYTHGSRATSALAWSPDGKHLAAAGVEPAKVSVWSVPANNTAQVYKQHERAINALAWSPDSQFVASASNDYTVQIWEARTGKQQSTYSQHTHWVNALTWSPDGALLASGDVHHQVHLWHAQGCQQYLVYRGHNGSILALAFAPDSSRVASADQSGSIQIWEVASGKLLTTYVGHQKAVSTLAWSPDGRRIVSGSWDGSLHIWEAASGKQISIYTGHQRLIKAVAWSHANGRIASSGKDQTVQIWDPQSGDTLYTYRGHTSSINALAWSPNGMLIASAGDDDAVHVWQAI